MNNLLNCRMLTVLLWLVLLATASRAQTTTFTYQGRLTDSAIATTATYDMQFKLFDTPGAGTGIQQGATITNATVQVTSGVFTVQLDFGEGVYSAATELFLEVSVRPAGSSGGYSSLAPRQRLTSSPFAIRSRKSGDSDKLGGAAAGQYVQTNDPRLSDARTPTAGSGDYIQNTTATQASSNFNISGNGTIGGRLGIGTATPSSILSLGGEATQIFGMERRTGVSSFGLGLIIRAGGASAGGTNVFGGNLTLQSGISTGLGGGSSILFRTPQTGISGATDNSYSTRMTINGSTGDVGIGLTSFLRARLGVSRSGLENDDDNSGLFVANSTTNNDPASSPIKYGMRVLNNGSVVFDTYGQTVDNFTENTTHDGVRKTGLSISSGSTFTGGSGAPTVNRGLDVLVDGADVNYAASFRGGNVGIGIFDPRFPLDIVSSDQTLLSATSDSSGGTWSSLTNISTGGRNWNFISTGATNSEGVGKLLIRDASAGGVRATFDTDGDLGIGTSNPLDRLQVVGDIRIGTSGSNGCIKNFGGAGILGTCSSDGRLKRDITSLPRMLAAVSKLRPVNFYWRSGEFASRGFGPEQSFGLIAQEVEKVLPELVSVDEQGYRAINYSKLPLLTIQAVGELKEENDQLRRRVAEQQIQIDKLNAKAAEIDGLKLLVCAQNKEAALCKEDK